MCEGGPDAKRTYCSPQSVHQPIHGQLQAILLSLEEERVGPKGLCRSFDDDNPMKLFNLTFAFI